jgi:hypothetical protein
MSGDFKSKVGLLKQLATDKTREKFGALNLPV